MTILITGSSGFLGRNLKSILKEDKKKFISISRKRVTKRGEILYSSLNKLSTIKKYKNKIDIVIHLANKYENNSKNNEIDIFKANFLYGINVFNFSKKIEAKVFINISSTLNPFINRYAYSKEIFREYLIIFNNDNIKVINLNLDMMFGYQDKRFFHNFISTTLLNKRSIKMTDGTQKRNISHVSNIIQQILYVINNFHIFNKFSYNLGSNYQITIKEFVKLISISIKNKANLNIDNKVFFGQIVSRGKERINNKHIASNFFKSKFYKNKREYLEDLKRLIEFEIDSYL